MLLLLGVLVCYLGYCTAQQCPGPLDLVCSCLQGNARVRCSGSGITEIPSFPASIQNSITFLELENNLITSINATDFQGLCNLRNLILGVNRIRFIEEGSFSSNTALEQLDLSNNMLGELPDNLFNSTQLFTLDLTNNNISSLSASVFTGVQEGAAIRLDGNQFQTLNQDTFIDLDLHELSLSGNPIRCDCMLLWFLAFRNSIGVISSMIGTCTEPAHLDGVSLQLITEDQLLCNCMPSCVNGTCNMTVGECECDDGYIGNTCDTPCLVGVFGAGCSQNCTCLSERESSPCDGVDGTCHCLPGYTGQSCEQVCPDDTFGADCLENCLCVEERVGSPSCDNVNGTCICLTGYSGISCEREDETTATTVVTQDTTISTEVTLPTKSVDVPIYGTLVLTVGASLVVIIVILIVALTVRTWVTKRARRNKILPEFSMAKDFL